MKQEIIKFLYEFKYWMQCIYAKTVNPIENIAELKTLAKLNSALKLMETLNANI